MSKAMPKTQTASDSSEPRTRLGDASALPGKCVCSVSEEMLSLRLVLTVGWGGCGPPRALSGLLCDSRTEPHLLVLSAMAGGSRAAAQYSRAPPFPVPWTPTRAVLLYKLKATQAAALSHGHT